MASWSELPHDLLRLIVAGLASPADCARFRAVCRSWRSLLRMPWVVFPNRLLMRSRRCICRFSKVVNFPKNNYCIGATDDWLAMDVIVTAARRTYSLNNFFSKATVLLPELDAIIGNVSLWFEVRQVLMKSPPTGLIALRTNSSNYPIILVQPGKGVWFPKPHMTMLTRIIDIAFLQDKLYGITLDEDLISLCLAADSHGAPTVTSMGRVINHLGNGGHTMHNRNEISASKKDNNEAPRKEEQDEVVAEFKILNDGLSFKRDDKEPFKDIIFFIPYLVESHGKLLMVRRQVQRPHDVTYFTRLVNVFEADMSRKTWVPVSSGLDGHALFISKRFSKSVSGPVWNAG